MHRSKRTSRKGISFKAPADSLEVMQVKQPGSVSINGVEIPSYQTFIEEILKLKWRIGKAIIALIACGAAILLIGIGLLLK